MYINDEDKELLVVTEGDLDVLELFNRCLKNWYHLIWVYLLTKCMMFNDKLTC